MRARGRSGVRAKGRGRVRAKGRGGTMGRVKVKGGDKGQGQGQAARCVWLGQTR